MQVKRLAKTGPTVVQRSRHICCFKNPIYLGSRKKKKQKRKETFSSYIHRIARVDLPTSTKKSCLSRENQPASGRKNGKEGRKRRGGNSTRILGARARQFCGPRTPSQLAVSTKRCGTHSSCGPGLTRRQPEGPAISVTPGRGFVVKH